MNKGAHIIVGGGLAGLFSAKVLLDRGCSDIYIIEKSDDVGGLLQHITVKDPLNDGRNFVFDHGTHFVLEPNHPDIRRLMREDLDPVDYHSFTESLQEAHVLNGKLYEQSGCASLSVFSEDIQNNIKNELHELRNGAADEGVVENFRDECLRRYGQTATDLIYAPAYKKFAGLDLEDLDVFMANFFAPGRLIAFDRQESIDLKEKDADWDWRIAYADCEDSTSDITKYYPKVGGIGRWLQAVSDDLKARGVRILTNTTITDMQSNGSEIEGVTLSSGETLSCAQLVWSLPSIFLAMQTNTPVPSQKPIMRQVSLVHLLVDEKPIERPHWVTVYDEKLLSYRITLYDNFAPSDEGAYRITVEILHGAEFQEDQDALEDQIFEELKDLGILSKTSCKLWSGSSKKPDGFPILSSSHKQTYIEQTQILEQKYENIAIVGRRPDTGGGQLAVMTYIWDNLKG
ncbi:MAG: FAD-dependent oxidoreductase [Alphaproteobacteria bacterium]